MNKAKLRAAAEHRAARRCWRRHIVGLAGIVALLSSHMPTRAQALPPPTESGAINALGERLKTTTAATHGGAMASLFALPAQTAAGSSPELSRRLLAVIAGKLELRQGRVLSSAGLLKRRGGWVLSPRISGGVLSAALDLYPPQPSFWDRANGTSKAPTQHSHASVEVDAEVQSFFPAVTLIRPSVIELPLPTGATAALACSGSLRPRLIASSRRQVVSGHYANGLFQTESEQTWKRRSGVHPFPLREPIITITPALGHSPYAGSEPVGAAEAISAKGALHWVSNTDRAHMFGMNPNKASREQNSPSSKEAPRDVAATLAHALPLELGGCLPRAGVGYAARVEVCGTGKQLASAEATWAQQTLESILKANRQASRSSGSNRTGQALRKKAELPAEYDVVVSTRVRTPSGALVNYIAARQVGTTTLHLHSSNGVRLALPRVGAQVLLHDLDRDGVPEVIHASEAFAQSNDVLSVYSLSQGTTSYVAELEYALPVADAITAIAACPPNHLGPAPLVVATGTRLFYLETPSTMGVAKIK